MTLLERLQEKTGYSSVSQVRIVISQKTKVQIDRNHMYEFSKMVRLRPDVIKGISDYLGIGKTTVRDLWIRDKIDKLRTAKKITVTSSHFGVGNC